MTPAATPSSPSSVAGVGDKITLGLVPYVGLLLGRLRLTYQKPRGVSRPAANSHSLSTARMALLLAQDPSRSVTTPRSAGIALPASGAPASVPEAQRRRAEGSAMGGEDDYGYAQQEWRADTRRQYASQVQQGPLLDAQLLGSHAAANGPTTLRAIQTALQTGTTIMYLICHGTLHNQEPYLWLEQENGKSDRVRGSALVQYIAQSSARPLIVVLASCRSAGDGQSNALSALGPRLVRAGVPAVIGFQGDVTALSARRLLGPLFNELSSADGVVD